MRVKKSILGAILVALAVLFPLASVAQVGVHVTVPVPPLPPPIPFVAPPNVVVLPGTDVYAVPELQEEVFYRRGWWWRYWNGHWYRSRYHDRGWGYYRGYPSWHRKVPPGWRNDYGRHVWRGHAWNPRVVHHGDIHRHWRGGQWRHDHGWQRPRPQGGRTLHGGGPGGRPGGGHPGGKPRGGPGGKPGGGHGGRPGV